jgi:hypothetical protein
MLRINSQQAMQQTVSSSDSDPDEETKQPPKDSLKIKSATIARTKLSSVNSANSDGSSFKEAVADGQILDMSGLEDDESAFMDVNGLKKNRARSNSNDDPNFITPNLTGQNATAL